MARHIIGVDVIGAFVVVNRLQLESRVVVWKNVGEAILGTIARKVGECAWLLTSDAFELLELFAESVTERR